MTPTGRSPECIGTVTERLPRLRRRWLPRWRVRTKPARSRARTTSAGFREGSLGIRVDGDVHLEAENLHDIVRFGVARIGVSRYGTQIRHSVFNRPLQMQGGSFEQHGPGFFRSIPRRGHIQFRAKRTITLIFLNHNSGEREQSHPDSQMSKRLYLNTRSNQYNTIYPKGVAYG